MTNKDSVQLTAYVFQHTYKCDHHCPWAIMNAYITCVCKCYIILYWVCCSFVSAPFHTIYLHHFHSHFIQSILFSFVTALLCWGFLHILSVVTPCLFACSLWFIFFVSVSLTLFSLYICSCNIKCSCSCFYGQMFMFLHYAFFLT